MAKVKVTQIKSRSGATKRQIANLVSLGIHRIHQSVEVEVTPVGRRSKVMEETEYEIA